ncbi:ArsR family transcriptional regulator [Geodermatophilus sp. TF02-6]|uniref:helix-turn-helix transcriptional regulator n=1 Tax=Geodermatophilus sp. TF02-6 TaxID=2250575 RepID=UPI000DE81B0F|nr:helix-turn-helix domain-containing protein [Geodermatophilus sp. TF02-6]RBY75738.1 ArsR family transcriptional regulator [Geodermatophilus sp. TF02-6]
MGAAVAGAKKASARSGGTRQRVLDLLRTNVGGLGVQDLAAGTGLHPNTVRFHLERLIGEGLVDRWREERGEPGRPPWLFTAKPDPDGDGDRDGRNYRLLAEMLTSHLSGTAEDPSAAAVEAGRAWGSHLARRPAPYRRTPEPEAVRCMLELLGGIGFRPRLARDDAREVQITHCPFRELAATHREVVCAVHLGLMQGALAEMRAPVTAQRLLPFVRPDLCVAHLAPVADGEAAQG